MIIFSPLMSLHLYRSYSRYVLGTSWNILEKKQNSPVSTTLALEIYFTIIVQILWMPVLEPLLCNPMKTDMPGTSSSRHSLYK